MRSDITILTQAADFIVKYGFLATGLLLIFIISPAVYKIGKATRVALVSVCFGIAFVISYGVLDIVQKYAPSVILSQRKLMVGEVLGVKDGYAIQIKSDIRRAGEAYTKREFDSQSPNVYNFPFILITSDPPSCLSVGVVSTNPNSDASFVFDIHDLTVNDMTANVELVAQVIRHQDTIQLEIWRELNGHRLAQPAVLNALDENNLGCGTQIGTAAHWRSIISTAKAQTVGNTDIVDLAARLRSDDVFTRREARVELSRQGDAFAKIDQLLDKNEYRLQLGAVVALAAMPDSERKRAPEEVLAKVRLLLTYPDKTMRDTAARALQ